MIVRRVDGKHHIIRQPDHARQSGVIAAHLREEFLGDHVYRREFLLATARHDDGWIDWESNPRLAPCGLPLNFSEIDKGRHIGNWSRGIFSALHEIGPFAASLLAKHALPLVKDKGEEVAAYFEDLLRCLEVRAWPDLEQGVARLLTTRFSAALSLADLLSLVACAGWEDIQTLEVPDSTGTPCRFTIKLDDLWAVRVDPWPFVLPELRGIPVRSITVPVGMEEEASPILQAYSTPPETVLIDVIPGGKP
ncbi:MAG: DUF3891 family protein [Candidatus Sumerlaeia bacterium]|nr:DUF3891 family protein [Candidatus Sumerlaeia bacterium]